MAYVGTPNRLGNDLQTLASIIQGEAGGEGLVGMQAVADVIRNRASNNFSGYGSGLLDQALARNQFQGQSSKVGPEALSVAQQLQSGTLPDVAGNAVYYANPGASTASWAKRLNDQNALKIGNHYFTDNANGVPFAAARYPGPDGPKGQESYPLPVQPQPQQQMDAGIPQDVASYAASDDQAKTPGEWLQGAISKLGKIDTPAPMNLGQMGDARQTGSLLLKALQQPTIADYLLGKRMA
jgi:hypothetical protein